MWQWIGLWVTCHYLNQRRPISLMHICITWPQWVNSVKPSDALICLGKHIAIMWNNKMNLIWVVCGTISLILINGRRQDSLSCISKHNSTQPIDQPHWGIDIWGVIINEYSLFTGMSQADYKALTRLGLSWTCSQCEKVRMDQDLENHWFRKGLWPVQSQSIMWTNDGTMKIFHLFN